MKGVYILLLEITRELRVNIGSLGEITLSPGEYIYIGSGQKDVEKRVMRHFKKEKKIKWHIDYLLSSDSCKIREAIIYPLNREYECKISNLALELGSTPIRKFGSSDCRCISHFFKTEDPLALKKNIEKSFNVDSLILHP
ncbi:MAG: GIY-YIG nuclease family protein [Aigarchaeota archaeon]|nr:GIY-YIG nuclease family protein [Aigarchaeota archaeon]MCX8193047.1 GIY-YIG nuclease family protein [Nitrososphaeria archaeon]MDW7986215.1 GIY-YIG nuclease family protein [Nitrososphaerota archaeon]